MKSLQLHPVFFLKFKLKSRLIPLLPHLHSGLLKIARMVIANDCAATEKNSKVDATCPTLDWDTIDC